MNAASPQRPQHGQDSAHLLSRQLFHDVAAQRAGRRGVGPHHGSVSVSARRVRLSPSPREASIAAYRPGWEGTHVRREWLSQLMRHGRAQGWAWAKEPAAAAFLGNAHRDAAAGRIHPACLHTSVPVSLQLRSDDQLSMGGCGTVRAWPWAVPASMAIRRRHRLRKELTRAMGRNGRLVSDAGVLDVGDTRRGGAAIVSSAHRWFFSTLGRQATLLEVVKPARIGAAHRATTPLGPATRRSAGMPL